jgi:peptidoglycan/xylan/chitin deacetylase (PgdA/CDA1 family)
VNSDLRRHVVLGCCAAALGAALAGAVRRDPRAAHRCGLLAAAAFLAPTLVPNCPWSGPVLRRLPTTEREIWLTIDDGPDPHDTPEILDVLARHDARASFFAIGRKVWRYPRAARAVVAAGHDLQNHTWSHPAASFWAATPACARDEITAGSDVIRELTGQRPHFFRAPAGLANPFVHAAARRAGLRMAGWSVRGYDGVTHRPDDVVASITRQLHPGAIVLLHEGPLRGLPPGTRARTLDRLLGRFSTLGYRTATWPPA